MKYKLRVWKPGSDLVSLLNAVGDSTHFGGLSELRYFVNYLGAIPVNSAQEILPDDIVLISNSAPRFHDQVRNLNAKKKIQIVSDLNLTIPDEILGSHVTLCQMPYPQQKNWYYSSIEKSILLFQKPAYNCRKKYTLVYGGGNRNGNRDEQYMEYLDPAREYVSLLFTSSDVFPTSAKIKDKVAFNELQKIYAETKYGIVISDPDYYAAGMLTQRYWEYCLNGMVAFVDHRYDRFNMLIEPTDFVRVKDSDELQKKIHYLEAHPTDKEQILAKQRQMIDAEIEFMKGDNSTTLQELIFGDL